MNTIQTDLTHCQACYGCVKACPVQAMWIQAGHVQVREERCIACASCVRACPQQVRTVRQDIEQVKQALRRGQTVVASVSPWLPAFLPFVSFEQTKQALLELGIGETYEATLGTALVSRKYHCLLHEADSGSPLISSVCPSIVHLVEKHYPDLISHLAPVVSPMLGHGRWLKKTLGPDTYVVFIGPCVAAKQDPTDGSIAGSVDAVLTFGELADWLAAEHIPLPQPEPAGRDHSLSSQETFSISGSLSSAVGWGADLQRKRVVTASGVEACLHLLESLRNDQLQVDLVDLMLCPGGCINGPSARAGESSYAELQQVQAYAQQSPPVVVPLPSEWPALDRAYTDKSSQLQPVTGAAAAESQSSELQQLSESISHLVVELTPNLVIAVDSNLRVVSMSPSAERAFGCDLSQVYNRPLSDFLHPTDDFVQAWQESRAVIKSKVRYRPDLIVEQTIVPAIAEQVMVAVMRDITAEETRREEMRQLVEETISRTHEVLNFQMQVAHEIASLLGETTAESKTQLGRLIQLMEGLEWLEVT